MRELKFRAWDGTQMLTEENFDFVVSAYDSIIKLDEYGWTEHGVDCVEQYTGLKDRNGKEIYENDILEDGSGEPLEYWVVRFEDGKFIGSTQGVDEDIFELTDLEIIGNIHENGDLLEEKWQ